MFYCETCDHNVADFDIDDQCPNCGHVECPSCGDSLQALPDD